MGSSSKTVLCRERAGFSLSSQQNCTENLRHCMSKSIQAKGRVMVNYKVGDNNIGFIRPIKMQFSIVYVSLRWETILMLAIWQQDVYILTSFTYNYN